MLRLTLRRYLRSRHLWILLGLNLPALFIGCVFVAFHLTHPEAMNLEGIYSEFDRISRFIFNGAFLHFGVIFGAIVFGSSALREETDEQTLHYLFLQPTPRWLILLGKFGGFLTLALPIYVVSLILFKILVVLPWGGQGFVKILFDPIFLSATLQEFGILILAVLIYSSIFLALSMFFKNLLYVLFIYGWEAITHFLPEALKNFSIAYYLKEMLPYEKVATTEVVAVVSEGPSILQTSLVLGLTFIICMAFSCWWTTHKQCLYGTSS